MNLFFGMYSILGWKSNSPFVRLIMIECVCIYIYNIEEFIHLMEDVVRNLGETF